VEVEGSYAYAGWPIELDLGILSENSDPAAPSVSPACSGEASPCAWNGCWTFQMNTGSNCEIAAPQ
jgi:hypothetical protein